VPRRRVAFGGAEWPASQEWREPAVRGRAHFVRRKNPNMSESGRPWCR